MHGCVTGRLGLRWGRGKTGWERLDAGGKVLQIAGLEGSGTLDFPTDGSISDGAPLAAASGAVSGDRGIFRSRIYGGGVTPVSELSRIKQ